MFEILIILFLASFLFPGSLDWGRQFAMRVLLVLALVGFVGQLFLGRLFIWWILSGFLVLDSQAWYPLLVVHLVGFRQIRELTGRSVGFIDIGNYVRFFVVVGFWAAVYDWSVSGTIKNRLVHSLNGNIAGRVFIVLAAFLGTAYLLGLGEFFFDRAAQSQYNPVFLAICDLIIWKRRTTPARKWGRKIRFFTGALQVILAPVLFLLALVYRAGHVSCVIVASRFKNSEVQRVLAQEVPEEFVPIQLGEVPVPARKVLFSRPASPTSSAGTPEPRILPLIRPSEPAVELARGSDVE